jgi:heme/copper-type cytochrome/quinol oxidase subunit 2
MHSTHSPAPKHAIPGEKKKFKEVVVTKTQGTVYDPLWYFLFIFVVFFIVWLRTEIVKIREAYWNVPGVTYEHMNRFSDIWWALLFCVLIAVIFLFFLNSIGCKTCFPIFDHRLVYKSTYQFQYSSRKS